jgi:hypothetical protein
MRQTRPGLTHGKAPTSRRVSHAGRRPAQPSDLSLLRDFQSIIHLDAKVAHSGFKFAMAEEQLHGPEILRPSIDERGLIASPGVV